MKNISIIYLILLCFFSASNFAQKAKIARADKQYDTYAYIDAIKTYERIAEKGYESPDICQKLGNAYFFNSELDKAVKWYDRLFSLTNNVDPVYYYRYAYCLRSIGDNEKANEMLKLYIKKSDNPNIGEHYIQEVNYTDKIKENPSRYTIIDPGINTKYSDYGSSFSSDNKLVFTSARDTGNLGQRKHSWTDQYFTNLYEATLSNNSLTPEKVNKFSKGVRSKFHESSAIFTKDGSTMYFTRNNYLEGKKGKDVNKITLIKLYKASFVDNDWKKITELPFNSDNYSTAHPALSPDEKTLYFVSDMPGTIGESDIFKVSINSDGSYGTPENLGKTINTAGKETFPFVSDENELYFASNTHAGLGGLDIFVSKIKPDGTFGEVQNVGADVNSTKDDFAFIINTKTRIGFFSSNREGGKGNDDIYQFLETNPLRSPEIQGFIIDLSSGLLMANSKMTLYNNQHKIISSVQSDSNGKYSFTNLQKNETYSLRAEKDDYATAEKTVILKDSKTELNTAVEKALCKVTVGDDLGKCFGIKWIYFDLDMSNIRAEAALDLAKILDVMAEYPKMKINICSHTDSRASHKYNNELSERRAKSAKDWLIKNGIDPKRLFFKGYGETQLVNKCSDGVDCTEEEHQQNRRCEFIIMAL